MDAESRDADLDGFGPEALELRLRRLDPDRWLASRLISDPAARAEVLALYALNHEFSSVSRRVSQPLLGEMRLTWWRESLASVAEGGAASHPLLQTLTSALRSRRLPRAPLDRILDARCRELDGAPFADEAALVAYLDDTSGALMEAAAVLLDPGARAEEVRAAGRAWGWTTLLDDEARWPAGVRGWIPAEWSPGGAEVPPDTRAARVTERGLSALARARRELRPLPVASFPAVAYVRLARDRLRGRDMGDVRRRAVLLWAAFVGRI